MEMYNAPGVYVQDVSNGSSTSAQASSSVGLLIGVTRNGKLNEPQLVTSWTDYINKFANGLDTPFIEDDYLSYAVHGFFANGGSQLYILSIKKNAVKAQATSETSGLKFVAANEGTWGNSIEIKISKSADWVDTEYEAYDLTVSIGTTDTVTVKDITKDNLETVLTNRKIKMWLGEIEVSASATLAEETIKLSGGTDGDELTDADYISALDKATLINDLTLLAVPGQTSNTFNASLMQFCDNNTLFPFIDVPKSTEPEDVRFYRKSITAWTGALAYPWGKVSDPLSGTLKTVPTCGHVMGLYARTIESVGVHKAPAGTNATINGFVELETVVSSTDLGNLNSAGVVVIKSVPNAGIVAWGARSLNSSDPDLKYVTDGLINLHIKKSLLSGTQYAVFEPNDPTLWSNVKATCVGFLETLRKKGALKGSAEEAYYVVVDSSNNTDDTIAEGQLNIDIGYAPVKPAEFVIIKLAHTILT